MNALTIAAIAFVVPLVLRWLSRAAAEPGTKGILAYPRLHRRFALFMAVVPSIGFGSIGVFHPPPDTSELIAWILVVLLFPSLALPLVLEFYRVSYTFDSIAINVRSPWSKNRSLRWDSIERMEWRNTAKWLDLEGGDGKTVVHISPWLAGLDGFSRVCKEAVREDVRCADPQVVAVLEVMAAGRAGDLVFSPGPPSSLVRR